MRRAIASCANPHCFASAPLGGQPDRVDPATLCSRAAERMNMLPSCQWSCSQQPVRAVQPPQNQDGFGRGIIGPDSPGVIPGTRAPRRPSDRDEVPCRLSRPTTGTHPAAGPFDEAWDRGARLFDKIRRPLRRSAHGQDPEPRPRGAPRRPTTPRRIAAPNFNRLHTESCRPEGIPAS